MTNRTDKENNEGRKIVWYRILPVCLVAVLALFGGYELMERSWLRDASPELIHLLHLGRGIAAAVIAAFLTSLILLRPYKRVFPGTSKASEEKRWKHRLQDVRLRTKIVVPMVGLAAVPAIAVGFFTVSQAQIELRRSALERLKFDIHTKARAIEVRLHAIDRDTGYLARLREVRQLAAAEAVGDFNTVESLRNKVEEEFEIFSQGKESYCQVRYLTQTGEEAVRINLENGIPTAVDRSRLQNKTDRYYVQTALLLEPGQIYISPVDLNVEFGQVETPPRGVLRYATLVAGETSRGRGLVVINVYADYLLSLIGPLAPELEAWLVDQDGTYLGYVGDSEERQKYFGLDQGRRLDDIYSPKQSRLILNPAGSELKLNSETAYLFAAPVSIPSPHRQTHWTLMIAHPKGPIEGPIRNLTGFLALVMTLMIVAAAASGVFISDHLARPIARLRQATRAVAAGDLERNVDIQTGGEIEELGHDFNVMRERLRQAQTRLSAWNLELRREVERQTDVLQRLQSGMARADKLASIGQISASVMHEVGNPLAAIKTRIQVTQQDEEVCGPCRQLLNEILDEVNRLASFLRGFSRLSRLGGHSDQEEVDVGEVARGVIRLVALELKRTGIGLTFESEENLPAIQGTANQLRHLIMNLILNAADASPKGGEVQIQLESQSPDQTWPAGSVCLRIIDRGSGIPPEMLDRIWDPFFTTKPDGTGLGLAICRQIVDEHQGSIDIESVPGKGTTVIARFPSRPQSGQGSVNVEAGSASRRRRA